MWRLFTEALCPPFETALSHPKDVNTDDIQFADPKSKDANTGNIQFTDLNLTTTSKYASQHQAATTHAYANCNCWRRDTHSTLKTGLPWARKVSVYICERNTALRHCRDDQGGDHGGDKNIAGFDGGKLARMLEARPHRPSVNYLEYRWTQPTRDACYGGGAPFFSKTPHLGSPVLLVSHPKTDFKKTESAPRRLSSRPKRKVHKNVMLLNKNGIATIWVKERRHPENQLPQKCYLYRSTRPETLVRRPIAPRTRNRSEQEGSQIQRRRHRIIVPGTCYLSGCR